MRSIGLRSVVLLASVAGVLCAQPAAFDHSAAIAGALRDIGGIQALSRGQSEPLAILAVHAAERAQTLNDLYEFQRILLRDYALYRDSLGRNGGHKVPESQYFLGRALHELGFKSQAMAAYGAVGTSAAPEIRALAASWNATLSSADSRGWLGDLARWRDGQTVRSVTCAPGNKTCELFAAIVQADVASIARLQQEMLTNPRPDFEVTIKTSGEPYEVEFYDPLPTYLLSVADYAIAAQASRAIKGMPEAEALLGVALFRTGRRAEAEPVLRRAGAASTRSDYNTQAAVVLGELLAAKGSSADADRAWKQATGAAAANMTIDSRSRAAIEPGPARRQAALTQFAEERSRGWKGMSQGTSGGEYLARALMRSDRPVEAVTVLEEVRPPSFGENLNKVKPDVLVLLSRGRYSAGRSENRPDLYPLARGVLAALAAPLPVVRPTLKLLQLVTVPANYGAVRSGNN